MNDTLDSQLAARFQAVMNPIDDSDWAEIVRGRAWTKLRVAVLAAALVALVVVVAALGFGIRSWWRDSGSTPPAETRPVAQADVGPDSKLPPRVLVQVRLVATPNFFSPTPPVKRFWLTCNPTGGTLPFAARICGDIARHPEAMLDPYRLRVIYECGYTQEPGHYVKVVVTAGSRITRFGSLHIPCGSPNDLASAVFLDAAMHEDAWLPHLESRLRCDDLAVLRLSSESIHECMAGAWTPPSEHLIRIAKEAPAIAALHPAALFPTDPGVRACTIPTGLGGSLDGLCGVSLLAPGGNPTVSFTESWVKGAQRGRHIWHVALRADRVTAVTQSGQIPPQLWY